MHDRTWRLSLLAMLAAVMLVASGSEGRAAERAGHPDPTRTSSVTTFGLDPGTQRPLHAANESAHTRAAAEGATRAKTLVELARRGRALLQELTERLQRWETELTPRLMALEADKRRAEETQRRQQQLEQELADLRGRTERLAQELTALSSRTQMAISRTIRAWPAPPPPSLPPPPRVPPGSSPPPPQASGACKEALPASPVELICAYYADLGRQDAAAAMRKWKTPNEAKLRQLISPIEWFELPHVLAVRTQTSTATVDIEVKGKNKGEKPQTWRGIIELEKVDGTWKIVKTPLREERGR